MEFLRMTSAKTRTAAGPLSGCRAIPLLLLLATTLPGLLPAMAAQGTPPPVNPEKLEFLSAYIVGLESRSHADHHGFDVSGASPVELYLVVEAEQDGIPVYCTEFPDVRVQGRGLPSALIASPAECGLESAEIHWAELTPDETASVWTRDRIRWGKNRWTLELHELPGRPAPGILPSWGTGRFAAAVNVAGGSASPRILESPGWSPGPTWRSPEEVRGFRVSRYSDRSLIGLAMGLARLPVHESLTAAHARTRTGLRPVDLALLPYSELAHTPLPTDASEPLDGEAWHWLFRPVARDIHRRALSSSPMVTAGGRGIPWSGGTSKSGTIRGDILLTGSRILLLDTDDGDGWLGEGDYAYHTASGILERGKISDIEGQRAKILRPRTFLKLRKKLEDAGYGSQGGSPVLSADLLATVQEFQSDHHLEETGVPDRKTLEALNAFLDALRSHETPGSPETH
jgi:hypothetical protein